MKTVRLLISVIVLALVFSVWTPATVFAKPAGTGLSAGLASQPAAAKSTLVKLTLYNKTGGTMFVSIVGDSRSYSFAATAQGKTKYEIEPGHYTYTITSSNCGGSLTKSRNFKGSVTIGPIICRK